MIERDEKFDETVARAEAAFWNVMQLEYAAASGDFPPDAAFAFEGACRDAADTWLTWNVDEHTLEKWWEVTA